MLKYYYITTRYDNHYKLDSQGYVLEFSNGLRKKEDSEDRKTWQIIGAWENIGFGHTRRISLDELVEEYLRDNTLLKSGKPRYGLVDIDHGTTRYHGNKDVHGVDSIMVESV